MAGVFGEEDALLRGGKAAPHHKDLLVGEELSVAGGAVGHAPAPEGLLPLEAHHPGVGPGGPEDAEAGQVPPAGADGFHIPRQVQAGDLRQEELRPEGLGLLAHGLGELRCRWCGPRQGSSPPAAVMVIWPPKRSFSTTSTRYRARAR